MNLDQKERISENLERMTEGRSFSQLLKEIYNISKISISTIIVIIILNIILFKTYINVGYAKDTIPRIIDAIGYSNNFAVAIFALTFTGYAIFQALTNSATLVTLISVNGKEKSKFEEFNLSFLSTELTFLFIIMLDFVLLLILKNSPQNWQIEYFSNEVNNVIASILFGIYITINLWALLEVKCFIFNLYKCFSINAISNSIDYLEKEHNEKNNEGN